MRRTVFWKTALPREASATAIASGPHSFLYFASSCARSFGDRPHGAKHFGKCVAKHGSFSERAT